MYLKSSNHQKNLDRPRAESQGSTETHERSLCSLKFCPIMGCTASFESEAELLQHNLSGSHQTVEIRSSMDEVKSYYAELIHASSNLHHDVSTETTRSCSTSEIVSSCKLLAHFRKPGWALPKRKHTKFSYKQRKFAYMTSSWLGNFQVEKRHQRKLLEK